MSVSFADYLQAKFALDERSLNQEVRLAYLQALRGLPQIQCLDVGAGTGATLRRFLESGVNAPLFVTALDRDRGLLDMARHHAEGWLRARGLTPRTEESTLQADGEWRVTIRFAAGELKDHRPDQRYNVITAHAFLDLTPLSAALRQFATWLCPGGYLYASINYDGETALAPRYADTGFEDTLLGYYNDTMERRRVDGCATGGAHCGRRLRELLPAHGFRVLAHGGSHWDITPIRGDYRDGDAICLEALLAMIYAEGQRSGLFPRDTLERWHEDRLDLLRQGRLALHVHHQDLLARSATD